MPHATFEEGTEIKVDDESVSSTTGWTDTTGASDVFRNGDMVTVSIRSTNAARAAWKEKEKYALGTLTTEGGKTYVLIKAEAEAEKDDPATDAGVHWKEVTNPDRVCVLPAQFRPAAAIKVAGSWEITTGGNVVALGSLASAVLLSVSSVYRAATSIP